MTRIEQAILVTDATGSSVGCRLAACGGDVAEKDRQALLRWGPSGNDLLPHLKGDAGSLNFHPLPSGAYCVSRTTRSGRPSGSANIEQFLTHCLIVSSELLEQFANHPFALAQAAWGERPVVPKLPAPPRLDPLELTGTRPVIDQPRLVRLVEQVGPWHLAMLVQAALNSACLAVAGPVGAGDLISALFDCLPPGYRPTLSFSTGLAFSPDRMYRLLALPSESTARRWLSHQPYVTILDLAEQTPSSSLPIDTWAQLIERVLLSDQLPFLAKELSKQPTDAVQRDLSSLGRQLMAELDGLPLDEPSDVPLRAHKAHRRFEKTSATVATTLSPTIALPSEELAPDSPELFDQLGDLDDAVFDAINGCPGAMDRVRLLWPQLRPQLREDLMAESRAQYLRYALSIWEQCIEHDQVHNPSRAVDALEVLCVLFDEV